MIWVTGPVHIACRPAARLHRGIAQLVEQRSPKPRAEGSSPSAPAKQERPPLVRRSFLFYRAKENPRHAERAGQRLLAPPVADTASWGWRSGRKNRGKAAARRFFRAPQEGLRSNFEPFCPCHRKSLETAGFRGFFFAFSRTAHGLLCRILMLNTGADFPSGAIC